MKSLQRLVVAVLLGIWCFPAVSLADTRPTPRGELGSRAAAAPSPAQPATEASEGARLAAREKKSQDLQDFKGGGVYIYLGSGVALVLLIILLIILLSSGSIETLRQL